MDALWACAWRDLRAALTSPLAWVVMAMWALVTNIAFVGVLHQVHGTAGAGEPLIQLSLSLGNMLLVLLVPALTMNSFVQERQQRTLPLLLSLPIPPWAIPLGKWLATMAIIALLTLLVLIQAVVLSFVSQVSLPHMAAAVLGLLATGAIAAAIGVWTSLIAESALTAFVLAVGALAVWALIGLSADPEGSWWARIAHAVGMGPRLGGLLLGRIALGDCVAAVGLVAVFLMLSASGLSAARRGLRRVPWITAGLAVLAVGLAVAAADRTGLTWDGSADRRFAVHPTLRKAAARTTQPVELIALWEKDWDRALAPVLDGLRATAAHGPRILVRRIDPVTQAGELAALQQRIGQVSGPAIVVCGATRAMRIAVDAQIRSVLQRELAGALLGLADGRSTMARFSQGHGELRIDASTPDDSAALFATHLRTAGFRCAPLIDVVRPDELLVIAGPTSAMGGLDLDRAEAHVRQGGALCVFADDRAPSDLAQWLLRWGVVLPQSHGPSLIVRHERRHDVGAERGYPNHRLRLLGQATMSQHPAVFPTAVGGVEVLMPWTSPLSATNAIAAQLSPLLRSVEGDAWVAPRTDVRMPDATQRSAALLGLVSTVDNARIAVLGSRQMAADATLADGRWANGRLLADLARWLARREGPADIPAVEIAAYQVQCSDETLLIITFLLAAILPCALLAPALLTWWDRRQGR